MLPDPGIGVNHGADRDMDFDQQSTQVKKKPLLNPLTLEDACVFAYLKWLETEVVAYIGLTQSKSQLIKGVAKRMLQIMKDDINGRMTGLASSVLREKMIKLILSDKFPSVENCNIHYVPEKKDADEVDAGDENDMIIPPCPNICCTGAFIQEGMMGVVMSAEIRQLIFTSDKVQARRHFPGTLEFNVPVVLTHLLGATDGRVSQLERLIFSENFIKEESEYDAPTRRVPVAIDQSEKQSRFAKHFGQGNIYDTPDRRGIAVDLLILFRDIHPKGGSFLKLTELVLKNNIQCKLYSKANFQFEFLARIGLCCPTLRVFDVFGTDTWADCLVALFFKDAFHSLHRYLYFMENEDDECSEYHPHDTTRYCQFCLDQWHPNQIERPYTNNPVIPLLDSVYDHVIKRYPKRSFCILRNCVRVSDLITATDSTVFELLRPPTLPTCHLHEEIDDASDPLALSTGIKKRLRSKSGRKNVSTKRKASDPPAPVQSCSESVKLPLKEESGDGISGLSRHSPPGCRRSLRINKCNVFDCSGSAAGPSSSSQGTNSTSQSRRDDSNATERWVFQPARDGGPTTLKSPRLNSRKSLSKSREILNLIGPEVDKGVEEEEGEEEELPVGIMTRSRKRRITDMSVCGPCSDDACAKKPKMDRWPKRGRNRERDWVANNARWNKGGKCVEARERRLGEEEGTEEKAVISYDEWEKTNNEKWRRLPATSCCHATSCDHHDLWFEPETINYRQIEGWPHLNPCVKTLEILNIGGSNVLGEFLPFLLLHTPKLKSLGQWLNTMIYGLEILKDLPGYKDYQNFQLQEFSYSSDRNYFCQPYIGFVPESSEFKNVRREMVRYSNKSAKRVGHRSRLYHSKRRQINEDVELMVSSCPNLKKVNLVVHYKISIMDDTHGTVWDPLLRLNNLVELDLVTMRFDNVRALLTTVGPRLEKLTVECDEEQGTGSEIVHLARHCPNITSLRILLGDKVLRGEMTLHFGQTFFRKLERLTVEGNVHLHGFAFLWGHCQHLKYMRIGLVVSNELTNTNVLIQDVFTLLFQVNKMVSLEELHIKNLKIRSLAMGQFLLDNLPNLKKASNWFLDLYGEDMSAFKRHVKKFRDKGLWIDYKEW